MTTRRRFHSIRPRPGGRPSRWPVARGRGPWAAVLLWLLAGLLAPSAVADPDYDGPLFYGLDPIIRATDDPRLLGEQRLLLRERLRIQGVDPLRRAERPTLATVMRAHVEKKLGLDLERMEEVTEANGFRGLYTTYRYPDWFFLFPTERKLPGGFSYYPTRPVDAPEVTVFVDDLDTGLWRQWRVGNELARQNDLDVSGSGRRSSRDDGLINFTIPVKLPRTLEKIIGRGEKTSIKITGREHISIRGETTRSNQFTANERVQSQSWFPDLDMEQQLQVNLSGQIGEKIFIEVDHDSEAIGPEGTKIKLAYRGDEDEIIQSIETGDVGLTLPGGQLLGYNSNKSGLFGVKVTGQMGPADFTFVASKQKAESDSKSFNSRGGEETEHLILASDYLDNRFFRLDLPRLQNDAHVRYGYPWPDTPGRFAGESIDVSSIRVYRYLGNTTPSGDDVQYVAAAIDSSGRWDPAYVAAIDADEWVLGWVWRPIDIGEQNLLRDVDGNLIALDLRQQMLDTDILAVTYTVRNADGSVAFQVGEDPNLGGQAGLPVDEQVYYRMKLLKPEQRDYFTFQYVLRNIYPLGGTNIDAESFDLRIETTNIAVDQPDQHGTKGLRYLRLFGLDSENPQGQAVPDGLVDKHIATIFDLQNGLLRFPLDFPFPFQADEADYEFYANPGADQWEWDGTELAESVPGVQFYDWQTRPADYSRSAKFRLVAVHAAASSVINLGASNIQEGSETVTLDGQTLVRDVDYTIDYLFGTVELRGEAAGRLTPDSNIKVNYQYSPFFGGGQSNLLGLNLGYDLGRDSKLTTTWLYESNSIVGEKAKLGEEPSRTLVGNVNLNHTHKSELLTDVANFIALGRRDRESSLAFNGEAAVSIPNPNTKGKVYLEDFEGAASSDLITLGRLGWYPASPPVDEVSLLSREPADRTSDVRWFVPHTRVLRRWLNPELTGQERDETQQAIEVYMREDDPAGWTDQSWSGIMRGLGRAGIDLSKAQFLEIWVNDFDQDPANRRGRLHIDFGIMSEDFMWPDDGTGPEYGTWQLEDLNQDGIFTTSLEDVGLDAIVEGTTVVRRGADYAADYNNDANPYPAINNTAANNYEDSEDLDGDTRFNLRNGYFTTAIDLSQTEPLVDVARDYPNEDLQGTAWRKYRIRLADILPLDVDATADIAAVKHLRIWYEDDDPAGRPSTTRLQLSELAFLGSRWEREGIRKVGTEAILSAADLGPDEGFFIGEINNKDNPDYHPPFDVEVINTIPEKETALILDVNALEPDHMIRIQKQVSASGDDYTRYETLSLWMNPTSPDMADLDIFYRLGADSTNYYEIGARFSELGNRGSWRNLQIDIADLTNLKNVPPDADGVIRTEVADARDGKMYDVVIRGRPDLRRVTRYYLGVANNTVRAITGQVWFNDILLEGAKTDIGLAEKVGVRLDMAGVLKVDFDWDRRDAEYHGLNEDKGQGAVTENWSFATNLRVDDFIPLLGFQLPISYSKRNSTSRPKYEINSDIEIVDEARRDIYSTLEDRESFSVRLSHRQSRSFLPRYLVDPWNVQFSGSRSNREAPTESSEQVSLQGSVNYNLQLQNDATLGDVPGLSVVPIVSALRVLPNRVQGSASFTLTDRQSTRRDLDGTEYPTTLNKTKPGVLTGDLEYRPLPVVTVNYKNRSERDLLRRKEWNGINIGEQNRYSQDMTLTFTVPKATQLPQSAIFAPVRTAVRGLNKMRPSLTYQGSYVNDTNPGVRQPGDPDDVHSVSNGNDWQLRAQMPLGEAFEKIIPERKRTGQSQQVLQDELAVIMQEARRDTALQFNPDRVDGYDAMSTEQRREAEEKWYREIAIERLQAEGRDVSGGGGFGPRDLIEPVFGALRGFEPISLSYTRSRNSGFGRLYGQDVGLGYRLGFDTSPDLPDTSYSTLRLASNENLSVSSKTRLTRELQLDVKYSLTRSDQTNNDSRTRNYSQDWPDLRLNLTGMERWGVFGGQADDRTAGWFRNSSVDVSYKRSKSVPNYTDTYYSPRRSTTVSPRWNMTFQSGMQLNLNGSRSVESQVASGVKTYTRRLQGGLELQREIRAQSFLAKMGLYRPGSQPVINASLNLRYTRNTTERVVPNSTFDQAVQGTQSISVQPRFSYNLSRNLSGAFSVNFSQNKNLATDLKTTTFGIGLEATFVF